MRSIHAGMAGACILIGLWVVGLAQPNPSARSLVQLLQQVAQSWEKDPTAGEALALEALAQAEVMADSQARAKAHFYLGRIARMKQQAYAKAERYFTEAQKGFLQSGDSLMLARSLRNLGAVKTVLGNQEAGIAALQASVAILEKIQDSTHLPWAYNSLGIAFKGRGDYAAALRYYQHFLAYSQANGDSLAQGFAANNIGTCYDELYAFDSARHAYQQGLHILSALDHQDGIAAAWMNLGRIDLKLGQPQSALGLFQKAKALNQARGDRHSLLANYKNMAWAYRELGDYKRCQDQLQHGLKLARELGVKAIEQGLLREMGDAHRAQGQYEVALSFSRKAIYCGVPQFMSAEQMSLPLLSQIKPDHEIIPTLAAHAQIFLDRYQFRAQSLTDLLAALEAFRLTLDIIDKLRNHFEAEASKLQLSDNNLAAYEQAIRAAHLAFEHTGNPAYVWEALQFSERSKAILLYEALQEQPHWTYPQFSPELTPVVLQSFFESSNYEGILSYFIGTRHLYAFLILPDTTTLYALGYTDSIIHKVGDLRVGMSDFWVKALACRGQNQMLDSSCLELSDLHSQHQDLYIQAAYALYRLLWQPITQGSSPLPVNLLIIPDGVLGYIPFDALLSDLPEVSSHFRDHAYLLRAHQLGYDYSVALAMLHHRDTGMATFEEPLLAIAPFSDRGSEIKGIREDDVPQRLARLVPSIREVRALHQQWGGELLKGEAATKPAFLANISRFAMLHVSSHAHAPLHQAQASWIAFSDSLLMLSEIARHPLSAELVVLSACETGMGPLAPGEGVISLARAFLYAGVPAVVSTLWPVQDEAMARIMEDFYQGLKQGLPKHEALRQARLAYLNSQDHAWAHPFFWAAIIPQGNMQPLSVSPQASGKPGLLLGLSILLIGLTLWGLIRRRLQAQ